MMVKIKELCFKIASFWGLGEYVFGWLCAAVLAVPVLLFFSLGCFLSVTVCCVIESIFILVGLLAIYGALRFETDSHPGVIVINHMLGMTIALLHLPLTIKFMCFGFILFYIFKYFIPLLLVHFYDLDVERLPMMVNVVGGDILAGVLVNCFFRLVLWLTN